MKYEYTPGLTRALSRAAAWASGVGQGEILSGHLLRALIEDEEAQSSSLLVRAGLDRQVLVRYFCPPPLPEDVTDDLPLADEVREILRDAKRLAAERLEESTLASDHVLLAILNRDEKLRDSLTSLGLDFKSLRELISPPPQVISLGEPGKHLVTTVDMDTARILDASANRGREALRVLEDFCRFVLNDAFLSGQLKQLRHDLAGLLKRLPQRLLLEARDTLHDVGTTLSTQAERERASLREVIQANVCRLQESLRTLEEYGKLFGPEFGEGFEKIRYQSYTLERALILGDHARQQLASARLYVLVAEESCRGPLLKTVAAIVEGGAQVIQLREKNRADGELLQLALEVRRLTRTAGVLFIVNDRPDIARLVEADGVHLGQEDMPLRDARRIVGPDALIGISTHNLEQVRRAVLEGASYIGVGPTFPSKTKSFAKFAGLEFVSQALAETSLPAFALGGVNLDNLPKLLALGCRRVAVSHAVCASEQPAKVASNMRALLENMEEEQD